MAETTIVHRLLGQADRRPEAPALYEKRDGVWRTITYRQYAELVKRTGRALLSLGFQKADTVSILGFNRMEWVVSALGAMAAGGAAAGIYTTSSSSEASYICGHAESKVLVLEDAKQWEKMLPELGKLPKLTLPKREKAGASGGTIHDPIEWDKNGDGKFDDEEREIYQKEQKERWAKWNEEYTRKWDANGDGKVDREEQAAASKAQWEEWKRNNPEQARKVIEEINAALAGQDAWMQRLPALIEKYGLSWEQAGEKANQARLDEIAKGLIQDFADLSKAGFDVTLITEKMSTAINEYVQQAM